MQSKRILRGLAFASMILGPLAAHAAPDQKNNRGYVVGKGGVARTANEPQVDGNEPASTVPKQTQGATFGEKVNAGLQQAGSADAPGVVEHAPGSSLKGNSGGGAASAAYVGTGLAVAGPEQGASDASPQHCQPVDKDAKRAAPGGSGVVTPSDAGSYRHDQAMNCVRNMR